MTELADKLMQCYDSRELPSWYEIYDAATRLATLSRQLAEAQEARDLHAAALECYSVEQARLRKELAEAQGVIERLRKLAEERDDLMNLLVSIATDTCHGQESMSLELREALWKATEE